MSGAAPAYPLRAALAGVLLFAIGLAIAGGAYRAHRQEQQPAGWRTADGVVIDLIKRRTPEGEVMGLLIAFTTAAGERVSFTSDQSRAGAPRYIDAQVAVLYHPGHPQDALIDKRGRLTGHAVAAGVALLLMALGGYVAWYASQWDRMHPTGSTA